MVLLLVMPSTQEHGIVFFRVSDLFGAENNPFLYWRSMYTVFSRTLCFLEGKKIKLFGLLGDSYGVVEDIVVDYWITECFQTPRTGLIKPQHREWGGRIMILVPLVAVHGDCKSWETRILCNMNLEPFCLCYSPLLFPWTGKWPWLASPVML